MSVSVMVVRAILAELERQEFSTAGLLTGEAAKPGYLDDMRHVVSTEELERLVERAVRITGNDELGLDIGRNAPNIAYQMLAHLALSAPTLAEAFNVFQRYAPLLVDGVSLSLDRGAGRASFRFHFLYGRSAVSERVCADWLAVTMLRFASHFTPKVELYSINFVHSRPVYAQEYHVVFGCPIHYRQVQNAMEFDDAILDVRQSHADLAMARVLHEGAEHLLNTSGPRASLGERVRALLARESDLGALSVDHIAHAVGMKGRALRRQLSAEGLSWSQLYDEVRCSLACEDLRRDVPVKDVAQRVGFSEPSAFHRAFKRWTGQTPAAFVRASSL